MGYLIKKVLVRDAATLSGAASTSAVSIMGATQVWFTLEATDANTLTTATKIEVSADGTNWVSTGTNSATPTAKTSYLASINTGIATTALNAGPATYILVNSDPVTGGTNEAQVIRIRYARVTATPTSSTAGFKVYAYVAYMSADATRLVDCGSTDSMGITF